VIVTHRRKTASQHVEMPCLRRHLVDPDRVDHDPQDREESEDGAFGARQRRLADRHAVHGDGDRNSDGQRHQCRNPGPQAQHAEHQE
jgi:hypothetical protein